MANPATPADGRKPVRVETTPASFVIRAGTSTTRVEGRIWVCAGGSCLPQERWIDYPITVLSSRCIATKSWLAKPGSLDERSMSFHDGPYGLVLPAGEDGLMSGVERTMQGAVTRLEGKADGFAMSLSDGAAAVSAWATEQKFESRDVDELRLAVGKLRAELGDRRMKSSRDKGVK